MKKDVENDWYYTVRQVRNSVNISASTNERPTRPNSYTPLQKR